MLNILPKEDVVKQTPDNNLQTQIDALKTQLANIKSAPNQDQSQALLNAQIQINNLSAKLNEVLQQLQEVKKATSKNALILTSAVMI